MNESSATYQSYLVRLWQDSPHTLWRASAHCVQTREIVHFEDLDALFTFLATQTEAVRQGKLVVNETVNQ